MHLIKRVLVTAGTGFLGSSLCKRLLNDSYDAICLDIFLTCTKDNVAHLPDHQNFGLMRHVVTITPYVDVDAIYNHTYPVTTIHYQNVPRSDH